MRKIVKTFASIAVALVVSILPVAVHASTTSIPTTYYDFEDGPVYEDAIGCGKYGVQYSDFKFYPNVDDNSLTVRLDAACGNSTFGNDVKMTLMCIDATTKKTVGSKSLYVTEYQYATFTGLDSSHQYYFKFTGNSSYYIAGLFYVSDDGLYPFKSRL